MEDITVIGIQLSHFTIYCALFNLPQKDLWYKPSMTSTSSAAMPITENNITQLFKLNQFTDYQELEEHIFMKSRFKITTSIPLALIRFMISLDGRRAEII
ncbi:hypothetical protein O5282_18020 [Escherichia coli]|nr:hypothetical protein [Escherichia coli]